MKKQIIKKTLVLLSYFLPSFMLAETINSGLNNPIGDNTGDLYALVNAVLRVVVSIGTLVVVLAVVYAGFLFIAARGNPEKINQAKSVFLWTVVGAIVLLGAEILSQVIQNTARQVGVNV